MRAKRRIRRRRPVAANNINLGPWVAHRRRQVRQNIVKTRIKMPHLIRVMVAQKIIQLCQRPLYVLISVAINNIDLLVSVSVIKPQRVLCARGRRSVWLPRGRSARRNQEKHRPSYPQAQIVLSQLRHPFLSTSILTWTPSRFDCLCTKRAPPTPPLKSPAPAPARAQLIPHPSPTPAPETSPDPPASSPPQD